MLANEIGRQGPSWGNLASSVKGGFENVWIVPALKAIDRALQFGPQDAEDAPANPPA